MPVRICLSLCVPHCAGLGGVSECLPLRLIHHHLMNSFGCVAVSVCLYALCMYVYVFNFKNWGVVLNHLHGMTLAFVCFCEGRVGLSARVYQVF